MKNLNIKYVLMASGGFSIATGYAQLQNPDSTSSLPSWFPYLTIIFGAATIYYAAKKT